MEQAILVQDKALGAKRKIAYQDSEEMKNSSHDHVIGIPVTSVTYVTAEGLPDNPATAENSVSLFSDSTSCASSSHCKQKKKDSIREWMSKFGEKAENYTHGIREHVAVGSNITETMKGKLTLGRRILQAGGVERVFTQSFSVGEGEKLQKTFQCYLSTTSGPISGMMFVSNQKVAFRSDRSLKITSPKGVVAKVPYKVLIPLRRIKRIVPSENMTKPNQKYIQMITEDDFEFWFMGFISTDRSLKDLQQAISGAQ